MPSPFEISDTGITSPLTSQARAYVVDVWRGIFGNDAQTSPDSPDGQMIDWITIIVVLVWQGNVGVANAASYLTAAGVQLDLVLAIFGRIRLPARASTCSFVLYGTNASPIPAATVASVESSQIRFATDAAATIGASDLVHVVLIKSATDSLTYEIEINSTTFDYTPGPGEDVQDVLDALRTDINAGAEPVAAFDGGTDEDGFARLVIESDSAGQTFASSNSTGDLQIFDAERVGGTAEVTGPYTGFAGEIDVVETPAVGLEGMTTTADAVAGRNRETDAEFRRRHVEQLRSGGLATPLAIRDRILAFVPTALEARVFENESSIPDSDGRPPNSFEAVVLSQPIAAPTDDAEILEQVLRAKPAGIQAYGSITDNLPDPQGFGNLVPVAFSRPVVRYLHLDIEITPGEGFPIVGDPAAEIKATLVEWLSLNGEGALRLGVDLVRFQLGEPINEAIAGIQSATIETDDTVNPGDPPTFSPSDISVDDDEILVADSSRITVTIL